MASRYNSYNPSEIGWNCAKRIVFQYIIGPLAQVKNEVYHFYKTGKVILAIDYPVYVSIEKDIGTIKIIGNNGIGEFVMNCEIKDFKKIPKILEQCKNMKAFI